jgi:deazaflavin-dependent oxidoreductase (nitroreductase family)
MTRLGRLALAISQFMNKRGLYMGRRTTRLHVALYRWSGGRLGGHMPGVAAARILLLDHVGARTGARRTSPLMYQREGDALAVVASKAGQPTHPAWFHNLTANPDTTIQIGSAVHSVRARLATDEERARVYPRFAELFPAYGEYQQWAAPRQIPVVILEPQ